MNMVFKVLPFLILIFLISCGEGKKDKEEMKNNNFVNCDSFDCLEENQNKPAMIQGEFRMYTPNKRGKGAGHMFWDWEVLLSDTIAIPAICEDKRIDLSAYNNKNVLIECNIFYGIVIGSPEGQAATGYRIDISSIQEQTTDN